MFGFGSFSTCVWVTALVICKAYCSCCIDESGIRLRVTNNCLQYAKEVGIAKLAKQLQGSKLRDNSGTAKAILGAKVDYKLSNMRVTQLTIPQSSFRSTQGVGLTLQASQIRTKISGDWRYKIKWWIPVRDSGSFDIEGGDLQFSVTVKLGARNGRPTISAEHCTASAGSVNVRFHGGASWLYNLFTGNIENSIKNSFQDMVCKGVRRSIDVNAARQLATFDINSKVGKGIIINYNLTRSPLFTSLFMDVFIKGQFLSSHHPQETPFFPKPPLPPSMASKRMFYIWLSDYVLNTAARVYHREGLLRQTIDTYNGKGGQVRQLDTNALKYVVYQLAERFPNRPAQIKLYTTQPPSFTSSSLGMRVIFVGNGEVHVSLANGAIFHAFTLKLSIKMTLKFGVNKDHLTGSVINPRIDLSVHESFIGDIKTNIKFFNGFFVPTIQKRITKKINEYGADGIPLPVIQDIHFVNTNLSTGNRYIALETDVRYVEGPVSRM